VIESILNFFNPSRQILRDLKELQRLGLVEQVGNCWRIAEITNEDMQAVDDMLQRWEDDYC